MSEDTSNPVYKLITDNLQQALINVLIALFFNTKVLQGSVSMHLSCDGIFNDMSLHYHCWVKRVKNFETLSTFAKVMGN